MKNITLIHNGFHGRNELRFRAEVNSTGYAVVSARVADRLDKAVCGLSDCKCGEFVAYGDMAGSPRRKGDIGFVFVPMSGGGTSISATASTSSWSEPHTSAIFGID